MMPLLLLYYSIIVGCDSVGGLVADDLGSLLHDFSTPFFLSESEKDVFLSRLNFDRFVVPSHV